MTIDFRRQGSSMRVGGDEESDANRSDNESDAEESNANLDTEDDEERHSIDSADLVYGSDPLRDGADDFVPLGDDILGLQEGTEYDAATAGAHATGGAGAASSTHYAQLTGDAPATVEAWFEEEHSSDDDEGSNGPMIRVQQGDDEADSFASEIATAIGSCGVCMELYRPGAEVYPPEAVNFAFRANDPMNSAAAQMIGRARNKKVCARCYGAHVKAQAEQKEKGVRGAASSAAGGGASSSSGNRNRPFTIGQDATSAALAMQLRAQQDAKRRLHQQGQSQSGAGE